MKKSGAKVTGVSKATIYMIVCIPSGKRYIGQTIQPMRRRMSGHLKDARSKRRGCVKLNNAIRKYDPNFIWQNFYFGVIEEVSGSQGEINAAETKWMKHFDTINNGYNLREGRSTGALSEETKRRISGKFIASFKSIREAAAMVGANPSHITRVAKGKMNKTAGFGWIYG